RSIHYDILNDTATVKWAEFRLIYPNRKRIGSFYSRKDNFRQNKFSSSDSRNFTSNAKHTQTICPIGSQFKGEYTIIHFIIFPEIGTCWRILGKFNQSIRFAAQSKLPGRTQHTERFHTTYLTLPDIQFGQSGT